jgi:PASTA domain-containing protein
MRRLLLLALVLTGCGSAGEVPDVRGMTVPAAQRELAEAGLRSALGTTLVQGADGVFAPGAQGTRVTRQLVALGKTVRQGDVVGLDTDRRTGLRGTFWERLSYRGGRVTISGLRSCIAPEHVELRPAIGGVRIVEVLGRRAPGACPERVVLDPGRGWSAATVAAPRPPTVPEPARDEQRRDARIISRALLPDRRTVLVQYETGGCHELAVARAGLAGRTVRLTILEGSDGSEEVCFMVAWIGVALVRLPAPAPPGVEFVHTRCGHEREPACG